MGEAVSLAAVKAYLRIGTGDEDDLLHRLIETATEACERFTGRTLLARTIEERIVPTRWWQRLEAMPVIAITGVEEITGGGRRPLDPAAYAIDIGGDGAGLVRVSASSFANIAVTYRAGLAETAEAVPAGLAQGIIRHVAHLHASRDDPGDAGSPRAVTVHWQGYRRIRIGGPRP